MKANRSRALVCLLAACLGLVCACAANPPREVLCQKLLDYFENLGYACELSPLADSGRDVPIAGPEAWDSLMLDGREEVLVYFDESNRADYLSGRVDTERYGLATVLACALCWCTAARMRACGSTGDDPQRVNMGRRFRRPFCVQKSAPHGEEAWGQCGFICMEGSFRLQRGFWTMKNSCLSESEGREGTGRP